VLKSRPLRIALIRHGESEANLDQTIFERLPDHAIPAHGRRARAGGHADIERQKRLRDSYGHFFYRFTDSESGADVYDRVLTFLETLHRDWDSPHSPRNVLIVSHGLTMRLFCMRWFHWSVRFFESLSNPGNAETRELLRQPDYRYKLDQPFEQWSPYTPSERESSAWSWCPEIR